MNEVVGVGKVSRVQIDSDNRLICEHCGSSATHHFSVDVYSRFDDAEVGIHTRISGEHPLNTTVDDDMSGNPSIRRQGLVISLWCENCVKITKIAIHQHKGITYIDSLPNTEVREPE